jgi:hypothetical protein
MKLTTIKKQYQQLQQNCLDIVHQKIGKYCEDNNLHFNYSFDVEWRFLLENDEVNENCELIRDTTINCYLYQARYVYDVSPDQEMIDLLRDFEDMFGNMTHCECNKGVWI